MKKLALLFALLCAVSVKAQTVSPISGLGVLQLLDNTGAPATQGCYYFYTAGTTQQQATFTDSTGQTQNTNPLCLTTGARANGVWLTSSAQYKIVACLNNDGNFCNASDILWSQDFLPASSGGGGGSASCSSGCVGFFISGTASPSTSGVLRMASADSFGWRNAAGSSNLLMSKDANDILTWQGGDEKYSEINCPTTAPTGADLICADVTAHRFKIAGNGGTMQQAVVAGVDISNTDFVTQVHFGASAAPFSSTLPSTNQALAWNGTNIVGATLPEMAISWGINTVGVSNGASTCASSGVSLSGVCVIAVLAKAHTLTRINYVLGISPAGCTTPLAVGVRDNTSATVLSSVTVSNGQTTGFVDSGALSVATTAGDQLGVGITTSPAGCTTTPQLASLTAVFQ